MRLAAFLTLLCAPLMAETKPAAEPFPAGTRWVALGDSITRGGIYHSDVFLYYATRFPDRPLALYNAGISGDTAAGGLMRLDWDVLPHKPTAVTIMMGTNDIGFPLYTVPNPDAKNLADRQAHFDLHDKSMRQLIDTFHKAGIQVTILIPPPIDETLKLDKPSYPAVDDALAVLAVHDRKLAADTGCGLVDFRALMAPMTHDYQKNNPEFTLVGADRVHPGPMGHLVMAYAFLKAQGMPDLVSKVVLDAAGTVTTQDNATISAVVAKDGGIAFTSLEKALPFPVEPAAKPALHLVPFMKDFDQEVLQVTGLKPGQYTLRIDDQSAGTYSGDELAAGINLAENELTPQYQQAQSVAALNAQRHSAGGNRTLAYLRRFVLDPRGIHSMDPAVLTPALEQFVKEKTDAEYIPGQGTFPYSMAAVYLKKPIDDGANLRAQDDVMAAIYKANQPVPHHYVIAPMPAPDLAARKAAFDQRNLPQQAEAAGAHFLALLMDHDEQSRAGLKTRKALAAVTDLAGQRKTAEALDAFRAYYFAKLADSESFGVPWKLSHSKYEPADLTAADALMKGDLIVNKQTFHIGEPGEVTPDKIGAAPYVTKLVGASDPWTPEIFEPLARAFVATKDHKYLDRWTAYLADWAMNDHWSDQLDPNIISDADGKSVGASLDIIHALADISGSLPSDGSGISSVDLARILDRAITALPALSSNYHWANAENWTTFYYGSMANLGVLLDEFKVGPVYLRDAQRRLETYNAVQNLPDGTETEHAHWYNAGYVQNGLQVVLDLARAKPFEAPEPTFTWNDSIYDPQWQHLMEQSAKLRGSYLVRETTQLGRVPIGARNDLRVASKAWNFAGVFHDEDVVEDPLNARVLAAVSGNAGAVDPGYTSEGFPWGGYYTMRDNWSKDGQCGDLFCSSVPTGGHGLIGMEDENSFGLTAFGADLLMTGGFGSYSYQRSPFRVDDQEEFFHAGIANPGWGLGHRGFMTSDEPQKPGPYRWHSSPQFDLAEGIYSGPYGFWVDDHHDAADKNLDELAQAASKTINDVTHQRVVEFVKPLGVWILTDRITSTDPHKFTQDFRLPLVPQGNKEMNVFTRDQVAVDAATNTITTNKAGGANITLRQFGPANLSYETVDEDASAIKNDYSYRYKLCDFLRIGASWQGQGSQQIVTLVYPRRAGAPDLAKVNAVTGKSGRVMGFEADTPEGAHIAYASDPNGNGPLHAGDITMTGESLLTSRGADGVVRGIALGVQKLSVGDRESKATGDFEFVVKNDALAVIAPINRPIDPVDIAPARNVFIDSQDITLSCPTSGVDIHYTLDGSEVTPSSPLYTAPFTLAGDTLVRVRAFRHGVTEVPLTESGVDASARQEARFQKVILLPAIEVAGAGRNLNFERYEGDWRNLIFFRDQLKPAATGQVKKLFDRPGVQTNQPYACVYRGYLNVPADGLYTFHAPREFILPSIEAGYDLQVSIGEGATKTTWYPATSRHAFGTWTAALAKGLHPFEVAYADYRRDEGSRFNHPGLRLNYMWDGTTPDLEISGPGIDKEPIPDDWLMSSGAPARLSVSNPVPAHDGASQEIKTP